MKKRKLKKEAKLLLILMILLIIVILLIIAVNAVVFNSHNSQNNNLENNIKENIAQKEEENENIIKVILDDPEKEDKTNNDNNDQTQSNNDNNNKDSPNSNEQEEENVDNKDNNNNVDTTKKDKNTYYIKINNKANVVTIYTKDSKGKYTVPVKAMICSIGTATPKSGVYRTSDMYTWRLLQGDVYGQYAVRITGHILFHSVPYQKRAKDSLEWWEYDKLGIDASLGCIRLTVEDAKWIYDNCPKGTQVEFYYSSDPGPLGKPTAKKISSYSEELKKWDPTDPDSKNPWKTYVETGAPSQGDTTETGTQPVNPLNPTSTSSLSNIKKSFVK